MTNFSHWNFDVQMADLYRFMRKILEKYCWDPYIAEKMLSTYDSIRPISMSEWQNLKVRFVYPEKYWKLANHYYTHNKAVNIREKCGKAAYDDPAEKAVGRISEKMPAAVMRLNKAKTKLPFSENCYIMLIILYKETGRYFGTWIIKKSIISGLKPILRRGNKRRTESDQRRRE